MLKNNHIFQRSYKKELFDDAIARMTRAQLKPATDVENFRNLQKKVETLVIAKQQAEVDLGDIPDEFKGKTLNHCVSEYAWSKCKRQFICTHFVIYKKG